jgi:DNA polymerase-3 subunit epsilon
VESINFAKKAYTEGAVFVAFDLETTGLDPKLDQIVEIGAVKFDNKGIIARFSCLINPGISMPLEAGRVNKITDEMLWAKPSLDEVFPDFLYFIQGANLVVHNAPFDCGFVNEKLKGRSLPNTIFDTLNNSRHVFPGLRSYSLQNLAAELQISVLEAHRAEDDALVCMEIFLRCLGINVDKGWITAQKAVEKI